MDPSQRVPLPPDAGISVIVPVHDFAGQTQFCDAWEASLARLNRPFEFHIIENVNLGEAIRSGLEQSTHPFILLIVPDFAYRPSDVRPLLEAINEADLVLGVRPGQPRSPLHKKCQNVLRWINRVVFGIDAGNPRAWYGWPAWRKFMARRIKYGLRVQDPECGLRLVRREMLNRCPIQSKGTTALVEMIAKINFAGGLLAEVPLSKPSDLPIMPTFAAYAVDERMMFRHPTFRQPADSHPLPPQDQPATDAPMAS